MGAQRRGFNRCGQRGRPAQACLCTGRGYCYKRQALLGFASAAHTPHTSHKSVISWAKARWPASISATSLDCSMSSASSVLAAWRSSRPGAFAPQASKGFAYAALDEWLMQSPGMKVQARQE